MNCTECKTEDWPKVCMKSIRNMPMRCSARSNPSRLKTATLLLASPRTRRISALSRRESHKTCAAVTGALARTPATSLVGRSVLRYIFPEIAEVLHNLCRRSEGLSTKHFHLPAVKGFLGGVDCDNPYLRTGSHLLLKSDLVWYYASQSIGFCRSVHWAYCQPTQPST